MTVIRLRALCLRPRYALWGRGAQILARCKTRFDECGWTESTGQKDIYAKKGLAAAAAATAAARVVLGSTLGRLQLGVDRLLVEALVVEFALLGVAEDVQCFAKPLEDLGLGFLDFWRGC